jgi:hypothetical protein
LKNSRAGSDVHQVAREATIVVAGNSPVIGRVQRIAEPGACAWCRMMSSRGAGYVTEATALSSGHAHCRCEIATVTSPKAIEQSRQAGQEAWRASELSSSKSPFRNRRGGGLRPDPALFKPGAKTSERETAIRAQIASYEQTLPGLRKAVADGGEAQRKALDWQEAKAAELRAELAGLPDAPGLSRQRPRAPIVGTSSSRRDRFAMSMEEARISSVLDDRVRDLALSPVASTLRAVERYQDGGHTLLNRVLWQSPESLQRLGDADLGRFRSMLNGLQWLSREFGSPGITVWRGIPTSRGLAVNRLTPGDQLPRLKGFISTSVGESVARSFLGDGPKGVLYRLSVPEGTPGAWLPPFGTEKWRWQAEFLLPPNCSILVTGVDLSGRVPIVLGEVTF